MLHSQSQGCHHAAATAALAPRVCRFLPKLVWAALMFAGVAAAADPTRYRVTIVDPGPEFGEVEPIAMNNRGDVLASAKLTQPRNGRRSASIVWAADRGARKLHEPADLYLTPAGISDDGAVYGTAESRSMPSRVFTWTESDGTRIVWRPSDPDEAARFSDVTASGRAAGAFTTPYVPESGVSSKVRTMERAGVHTLVWLPDGSHSTMRNRYWIQLNDAGQAVLKKGGGRLRFLDVDGSVTSINTHDLCLFYFIEANELSPTGIVVGSRQLYSCQELRAYAWTRHGGFRDLGDVPRGPSPQETRAHGVNSAGTVVGDYAGVYTDRSLRAFIWNAATGIADLTKLLDPQDPASGQLRLTRGVAINESGQILASASTLGSPSRNVTVVLTPVDP